MERGTAPAPSYFNATDSLSVPPYSAEAQSCERVFQDTSTSFREFNTPHMRIRLKEHVWGLSYGLNGTVEGSITFVGSRKNVGEVKVTLDGHITTLMIQRGLPVGHVSVPLVSRSLTLYSPESAETSSVRWDRPHDFSIDIPAQCSIGGKFWTPLPPSFSACLPGISCDVVYKVRVNMTRKGFRRRESKDVLISYLPKTRPSGPPMRKIPSSSLFRIPTDGNVKNSKLSVSWNHIDLKHRPPQGLSDHSSAVFLTIPACDAFASGQLIPFVVNIMCPESPALVKLYAPHLRLSLIRRTRIWSLGVRGEICARDMGIQQGEVRSLDEEREGFATIKGVIQAGKSGREGSWRIEGIAEVKYVIRIVVQALPGSKASTYLPRFHHEEPVTITTDQFGMHERELLSTGGVPPPALGMFR